MPFLVTGLLILQFRKIMLDVMPSAQLQRTDHRSFISVLIGFSFSALLAIIVFQSTSSLDLHIIIYYLYISFIFYYLALNIQSYKAVRWHDKISDTFVGAATLSLFLSVASCLNAVKPFRWIYSFLILGGFLAWAFNYCRRLNIEWKFLTEEAKADESRQRKES